MFRTTTLILLFILFSLILLAASACGGQVSSFKNTSSVTAKQTTINAQVNGDYVSIPLSDVEKNLNSRFQVKTAKGQLSFMSYKFDNQLYVRADICPPCGSESFTLTNGTLVCDSCGTVFNAKNGAGVRGACVNYPKAAVSFEIKDGNIVMKDTDLVSAFQNTLKPQKS